MTNVILYQDADLRQHKPPRRPPTRSLARPLDPSTVFSRYRHWEHRGNCSRKLRTLIQTSSSPMGFFSQQYERRVARLEFRRLFEEHWIRGKRKTEKLLKRGKAPASDVVNVYVRLLATCER